MFCVVPGNGDGARRGIVAGVPISGHGIRGGDLNRVRSSAAKRVREFTGNAASRVHLHIVGLVHCVAVNGQHAGRRGS